MNERETLLLGIEELERLQRVNAAALDHLTGYERMSFTSYIDSIVEKQCEKRIEEKSKTLYSSKSTVELPADPQRYVHNFSDLILDKFMLEVSSLGHNFAYRASKSSQLDLAVQYENLWS